MAAPPATQARRFRNGRQRIPWRCAATRLTPTRNRKVEAMAAANARHSGLVVTGQSTWPKNIRSNEP